MVHPNVTKFVAENGEYVEDDTGVFWVFETGAILEPHSQFGALIPAFKAGDRNVTPMMIKKTLRNKLYYCRKRLGQSLRQFEDLKRELTARAKDAFNNCAVPPSAGEVDKLHELKDAVLRFEELVTNAEAELNPAPKPKSPERLKLDEANRENSKAMLENIESIEV